MTVSVRKQAKSAYLVTGPTGQTARSYDRAYTRFFDPVGSLECRLIFSFFLALRLVRLGLGVYMYIGIGTLYKGAAPWQL